jgi:hypothetical protein
MEEARMSDPAEADRRRHFRIGAIALSILAVAGWAVICLTFRGAW